MRILSCCVQFWLDRLEIYQMTWTPITIDEINELILKTERELDGDILNFWRLIRIQPTKWNEDDYGKDGNGFWVVGLIGTKVIYYNDIEEGFNISEYTIYGTIDEYVCNQDELVWTIRQLFELIKSSGQIQGQRGQPTDVQ